MEPMLFSWGAWVDSLVSLSQSDNHPVIFVEHKLCIVILKKSDTRPWQASLLRSRTGRSHVTLPVPTRLLQTDIHSFLGVLRFCLLGPISLSFSCHCIRCTNHRREHSQENESHTLIGLFPRKECMSVWSSRVGTRSVTWLRPERQRRRLLASQIKLKWAKADWTSKSCKQQGVNLTAKTMQTYMWPLTWHLLPQCWMTQVNLKDKLLLLEHSIL